jgi:glycosyltransferase involved in cell wall biosynthesis
VDCKNLKVAFYVGSAKKSGGGFQYEIKTVKLLKKLNYNNFYIVSDKRQVVKDYEENNIDIIFMKFRQEDNSLITFEEFLNNCQIDLVYFLTPSDKPKDLVNIPYVMTVWDLCHRDYNEFPEVRNNLEFDKRENRYTNLLKKAICVTTDSNLGKENICYRYGIDKSRVKILKFLPRDIEENKKLIKIKDKYDIDGNYVYYPAQFWAHKNHIYILKALKILKDKYNIKLNVVFSGTDYGNLDYILNYAKNLNIQNQVHYIGFVSDDEIVSLYKYSIALVMPTYFGPTNIPPLEAFKLKVPVCYSDLDGLKEQVGDAAFLMDLKNPNSLVNHLITILNKDPIVNEKIKNGSNIINSWTEEDFIKIVLDILNEYAIIRECWE